MNHAGGDAILATREAMNLNGRSPAALEEDRQVTEYVRKGHPRRDSPRAREEGWQIGAGQIEAACTTVVPQRRKPRGMRWGRAGADAVCHLRAVSEGETGQWATFWERSLNECLNRLSTKKTLTPHADFRGNKFDDSFTQDPRFRVQFQGRSSEGSPAPVLVRNPG